jgi:hypothetical protein
MAEENKVHFLVKFTRWPFLISYPSLSNWSNWKEFPMRCDWKRLCKQVQKVQINEISEIDSAFDVV